MIRITSILLLQVRNFEVAPFPLKVLQDKTPMAVLRCSLAAEEHSWHFKQPSINSLFDFPLSHERYKLLLVVKPTPFLLLVSIEQSLSRREHWLVEILRLANLL